jgi:hypothetical protein
MLGYFFLFSRPLTCIALSNSILKRICGQLLDSIKRLSRMREYLFLSGNCSMSDCCHGLHLGQWLFSNMRLQL